MKYDVTTDTCRECGRLLTWVDIVRHYTICDECSTTASPPTPPPEEPRHE